MSLRRLHADHGIFITKQGVHGPMISIWVNKLNLFTLRGSLIMKKIKDMLTTGFKMVDMGLISYYLGLKVERDRMEKTIKLLQPAYVEKVLH